jgi:hypothetical protein
MAEEGKGPGGVGNVVGAADVVEDITGNQRGNHQ